MTVRDFLEAIMDSDIRMETPVKICISPAEKLDVLSIYVDNGILMLDVEEPEDD